MEILVIILSAFLALFLLIGMVLVVLLIKVTSQIKRVTTSAERTVNGLESVVAGVGKVTTPAMLAKLVLSQVNKRRKK
ncbi:hypothetical protein H7142_02440 [Candidatus Saccharibacteria bacterium]|nr:hypothetical protein [Candidatus Saccharibacteria bacterium]